MASWDGDADAALNDCTYLVTAAPSEVIPLLGLARSREARLAAAAYRLTLWQHRDADPAVRRQVLSLDAARLGDRELARRFAAVPVPGAAESAWTADWATGNEVDERLLMQFQTHETGVHAVACTTLDGRPVAVTGGENQLVRVWDLATGEPIGEPMTGHDSTIKALACAELDGRPVIVSCGGWGDVWIWDLATREPVQAFSAGDGGADRMVCAELDGRLVAITGGLHCDALVWDAASGERVGQPMPDHPRRRHRWMEAMACTKLDGRVVLVTVGEELLLWDLATGERIAEMVPPGNREFTMSTVACTELNGRPVAVAACNGGQVLIWDLLEQTLIGEPLGEYIGGSGAAICTDLDGRRVALIGHYDGTVRVWDLAAGRLLGIPVAPPVSDGFIEEMAYAEVGGRPVVVTCSVYHGLVSVWQVGAHEPVGQPTVGHTHTTNSVAVAEIAERAVVVSGGGDRVDGDQSGETARLWDLNTGEPIGAPMAWLPDEDGDGSYVGAVTYLRWGARDVVVAGVDRSVWLWDLRAGTRIGKPMEHTDEPGRIWMETVACAEVNGRPVAVSCCNCSVRVWDLHTGKPFNAPAPGAADWWVRSVACTTLNGRAVMVTGGCHDKWDDDDVVQVWDLATGEPVGEPMFGHETTIVAMACTEVHGRPVAVSGDEEGVVRIWDLTAGRLVRQPLVWPTTKQIQAVACTMLEGRPVAMVVGDDRTVRAWDLANHQEIGPALRFPNHIWGLTATPHGRIVVAFTSDIAVLSRVPTARA